MERHRHQSGSLETRHQRHGSQQMKPLKKVALVLVVAGVALLGCGIWLRVQVETRVPRAADIAFLEREARSARKYIQDYSVLYFGQRKRTLHHAPRIVYSFDMPLEKLEELVRRELKARPEWVFNEAVPGVKPYFKASRQTPDSIELTVTGNQNVSSVTVEIPGAYVSDFEARVLSQLWTWEGDETLRSPAQR